MNKRAKTLYCPECRNKLKPSTYQDRANYTIVGMRFCVDCKTYIDTRLTWASPEHQLSQDMDDIQDFYNYIQYDEEIKIRHPNYTVLDLNHGSKHVKHVKTNGVGPNNDNRHVNNQMPAVGMYNRPIWSNIIDNSASNHFRYYSHSRYFLYPYVLRNIHQEPYDSLHEIVDCGIYDLLKPPFRHKEDKIKKWKELINPGVKVVPDYPDIAKEHNVKEFDIDNVEESKNLLLELYNPEDPYQMPVIQGKYEDIDSFRNYIKWFKKEFPDCAAQMIGIGTVCKTSNVRAVKVISQLIRENFKDKWLHAFGLRLDHLPHVYSIINSWDSQSYNFRKYDKRRPKEIKVQDWNIEKFQLYLERVKPLTNGNYDFKLDYNSNGFEFDFD